MLGKEGKTAVEDVMKKFEISLSGTTDVPTVASVNREDSYANVNLKHGRKVSSFKVRCTRELIIYTCNTYMIYFYRGCYAFFFFYRKQVFYFFFFSLSI